MLDLRILDLTWRWGGSAYVEISPSIALGETAKHSHMLVIKVKHLAVNVGTWK